jgi:fibronectin type 3 domain-containing protein/predicted SAM-dependent methyltransferase/subtilisin-like proprotein convertase family protein
VKILLKINKIAWSTFILSFVAIGLLMTTSLAEAASQFGTNSKDISIPDNNGWVYSPINIYGAPSGATITAIDVYFVLKHDFVGDVQVALANADDEGVYLRENEGTGQIVYQTVTGLRFFNGDYVNQTWKLCARDIWYGQTGYIDYWWIKVHYGPPSAPTLISPANGSNIDGTKVDFEWETLFTADNYWMQMAYDSSFTSIAYDTGPFGNYIGFELSPFPDNGTIFYWRAKAGNDNGWSDWSSVWSFTNGPSAPPPTPALVAPGNGSNVAGGTVSFEWEKTDRANKYHIQTSLDSSFSNLFYENQAIGGNYTGLNLSGFPDNGSTYYWRLRAGNSLGWSSWSLTKSFTNGPGSLPSIPTLAAPNNGSNAGGGTVSFQWEKTDKAGKYHIQLAADSSFSNFLYENQAIGGNYTGLNLSGFPDNGGIYYWRLRAGNSLGWSNWSSVWNFTNGPGSPPPIPILAAPNNGSNAGGGSVSFQWERTDKAEKYHIQLAADSSFSNFLYESQAIGGNYTGLNLSGFPDNGNTYYWRLRAGNSLGWSNWSSVWNFTNGPGSPPPIPALAAPDNGSNAGGGTVSFQWGKTDRAGKYHIQLAADSSFSNLFYENQAIGGNYTGLNLSGFPDNGRTYYWRLRAGNSLGWSSWSLTRSFTNGPSSSPPTPALVAPNNGSNVGGRSVTFEWVPTTKTEKYHIQLAADSSFSNLFYENQAIGGNYTGLNLSGFPDNGSTYYWRLRAGNSLGWSSWSSVWSFTNGYSPFIEPPTGLTATPGPSSQQITLRWNANNESDLDYYRIFIGTSSGSYGNSFDKVPKGWYTGTTISDLSNGTRYYFAVTAVNTSAQESGYSNEASAIPEDMGEDTEPPTAPTNLSIIDSGTGDELQLSWTGSTDNEEVSHYLLYRLTNNSSVSEANYDFGFPIGKISTNYTDYDLTGTNTYYYKVLAVDSSDNRSNLSNLASASPADTLAPSEPGGIGISFGDKIIDLWWTASTTNSDGSRITDLAGYNIYRGTSSGGYGSTPINGFTPIRTASYHDTGLTNDQDYYYVIKAVDDAGNESSPSIEVSATPNVTDLAPAPPTGVILIGKPDELKINWNPNKESDLEGYNIYRATTSGGYSIPLNTSLIPKTKTSYTDATAVPKTNYYYVVRAVDKAGQESVNSNEVSGKLEEGTLWIIEPTFSKPEILNFDTQTNPDVEIFYHLTKGYLEFYSTGIKVELKIRNNSDTNQVVYHSEDLDPRGSGENLNPHFIWHGKDMNGNVVAAGKYDVEISLYYQPSSQGNWIFVLRDYEPEAIIHTSIEIISVDASDPYNTKVNYRTEPSNVIIDSATFTAPGKTETRNNLSGDFYFTYNQDDLNWNWEDSLTPEIISLVFNIGTSSYVKESAVQMIKKNTEEAQEIVTAYFLAEGVGLRIYNHMLRESYYKVHYSVRYSGKTIRVGSSSAALNLQSDYHNIGDKGWSESHKYIYSGGSTPEQMMMVPSDPIYANLNTRYKESSSNLWPTENDLMGIATVKGLIYNYGGGHIAPAVTIQNANVDRRIP